MLPWTEKYRPSNLNDIVLDNDTRRLFNNMIELNTFPNMLLYGPPGTGKTTTVLCLLKHYNFPSEIIHLNTNNIHKKSACFWCTYDFDSPSIHIPTLLYKEKYNVYGCFCSPECATSYLFNEHIDDNTKFERYQLLNYLYGKIYNYEKNIKLAPNPYYTLNKFYGNLNIQEYRQLLTYERLILIMDKPLTKIYPELHEDNNEFETMYDHKIVLKKNNKIEKNKVLKGVFGN